MYSSLSSNPSERAKALLIHYFKLLFKEQGIKFDSDSESEIAQIIDDLIEAAVKESKSK